MRDSDEVLAPKIDDERMVDAEAPGRPDQGIARQLERRPKAFVPRGLQPRIRVFVDGFADLPQRGAAGAPAAAADEDAARLQVQIEAGRVRVPSGLVAELDARVGLVGALVPGEARVPVDAEQGAAVGPGIRAKAGADAREAGGEIRDEPDRRGLHISLVARLVQREPLAVVVCGELGEEFEGGRGETGAVHGREGVGG